MTVEQIKALKDVADAVIEVVRTTQGTFGTPGGHLYAAMMAHGCTIGMYQQIMDGLVKAGKLRKQGECFFVVEGK
jgi:hypothetical protein